MATVGMALLPGVAAAQIPGLPYFTDPYDAPAERDASVSMTIGHALDDAGEEGLVSWTLGRRYRPIEGLTFSGAFGLHYPDAGDGEGRTTRPQAALAWDWILVNGTDVILGLHNGLGYRAASGGDVLALPLGLGLTWFGPIVPTWAGPQVAIWALPRGEYLQRSRDGVTSDDISWGASFGVSALTSGGAGINLGADYRRVASASPVLPFVPEWSFALMLRIRR